MPKNSESKLRKNLWYLVVLIIAGSIIYGLPYFRTYYYDAYLDVYNLTNTQMGTFGSVFGIFGAVSYLFRGIVADMMSPRKLMSLSLVLTGAAGLVHLMHPGYIVLLMIYMVWGFSTLFGFWPALLKGLRTIANTEEQSKTYGFFEGGRGIVNAVHLAVALAIFNVLSKATGNLGGLNGIIVFYSAICIVLGIIVFLIMKDDKSTSEGTKFNFKQVAVVLKLPSVWILSLILCCNYVMNLSYFYFTPYATSTFGVTATIGAVVTVMAQYIRPVAASGGGIVADRIGRGKTMNIGFLAMGVCSLLMAFTNSMSMPMFMVTVAIIYFGMYFNYGIPMSMMTEGGIPLEVAGTAIGIVSTLGYLPEIFVPLIAGQMLDKFGNMGYKYYFIGMGIVMFIGMGAVILWDRFVKVKDTENDEIDLATEN